MVLQLAGFFGGGDRYTQRGWTLTFVTLMVLFIVLNLVTFYFCKERVVEDATEENQAGPSILECLKSLVKNKYWLLMVVFLFSDYFMMSTFFGSAAYFAEYVLGDANLYATLANSLSAAQIVTMFATPFVMKYIGKRYTALIGMGGCVASFVLTSLAGTNLTLLVLCNVLKGAAFGCCGASMFGLLQDSITYGSWLTGVKATGMGNAASSFCMKIGSGIGTAALGWILSAGNFDANPNGAASIAAINVSYVWVPVITCAISVACMVFFDLDKYYDRAISDLAEGKWKGSK
ncbi:MAG: MFS transporter [Clostridiales bacterium]|nr:MFS transporter [Clostridiales bacterium]